MSGLARAKLINSRLIDIYAQNNILYLDTVPRRIQIIPTERCNYRCIMFFQSEESHLRSEELDFSIYEKLQDIFPFVQSVYFTGGEPLMYSEMPRALEYLSQYGISLSMSTNGSLLNGKRLEYVFQYMDNIKISIDAATPETYAILQTGWILAFELPEWGIHFAISGLLDSRQMVSQRGAGWGYSLLAIT